MTSTTLAAALTLESRSITLAGGTLTVGSLVAVDSEYLRVTEVYTATMGKVQRGVNGSSSAAHDNGADAVIGTAYEFLTGPAIPPPFGPADDALTAQGPSLAPSYAGGGGGGSILHQATVTLTDAQMIDVGDGTPFIIVPATETLNYVGVPVLLPMPQQAMVWLKTQGTPMTGTVNLQIDLGSDDSLTWSAPVVNFSFASIYGPVAFMGPAAGVTTKVVGAATTIKDSLQDNAVVLAGFTSDLADGVGNVYVVAITYLLFNTSTGLFE